MDHWILVGQGLLLKTFHQHHTYTIKVFFFYFYLFKIFRFTKLFSNTYIQYYSYIAMQSATASMHNYLT